MKSIYIIGNWDCLKTIEVEAQDWAEAEQIAKELGDSWSVIGKQVNK